MNAESPPKYGPGIRKYRSRIFYSVSIACGLILLIYLFFALRPLIMPVLLGLIVAYICQPLLVMLYQKGVPRWAGTLLLSGAFLITLVLLVRLLVQLIPDDIEQLELRATIQKNINERYQSYMGLNRQEPTGNYVHELAGPELDPLMDSLNMWLFLNESEQQILLERNRGQSATRQADTQELVHYLQGLELYTAPGTTLTNHLTAEGLVKQDVQANAGQEQSFLLGLLNMASLWLITPVMFLFFLLDQGQMRRGFMNLIPNTYFEMVLTVIDNVDRAIGNYLRGTLIETILMSITVAVLLALIGFEMGVSLLLGLISGIANAIPIFGMFIGIGVCVIYALMINDVSSVLPFVTLENLILWTIAVHLLAQSLDNAFFKPFVLGKAVDLHPITVFLGAIVGSILFGFLGLLFAIPAIVILKEIAITFYRELKAYFIIY